VCLNKDKDNEVYRFNSSTHGSHAIVINSVGKNKKVLDVGCNKGYLSHKFKENGCHVVGIEADSKCAEIAKEFCDEVLIGDIEQIETLSYPDSYFDAIVFADILEHLKDPQRVLLKLGKYLSPDGIIIVSLPNIARLDIRLRLLFGKFNYEEAGILDKSHLRFFTLVTAKNLIQDSGYQILHINYSGSFSTFLRLLPAYFAFQFIIIAEKHKNA